VLGSGWKAKGHEDTRCERSESSSLTKEFHVKHQRQLNLWDDLSPPRGLPTPPLPPRPFVVVMSFPTEHPFSLATTAADLVRYEHESFHAPALEFGFCEAGYYPAEQLGDDDYV